MSGSDWSPIGLRWVSNQACRSPNGSPIRLVGPWWVRKNSINIRDTSETNMLDRRLIGDPLETSTCFIRDQNDWSDTYWRPTCPFGDRHACFAYLYCNNLRNLIRHVSLWLGIAVGLWSSMKVYDQKCQSSRSLQWGMAVYFGSPMKHVEISDGSPIRNVGLGWGMSVSNESPVNSSLMGLR